MTEASTPEPISLSLAGRTVLITGGARGIGRSISEQVASAGARVILAARTRETLDEAVEAIKARHGVEAFGYCVDLADRRSTLAFAEQVLAEQGRIDVFVQNAAFEGLEKLESITEAAMDAVLETNLVSTILLCKALTPAMVANGWGRLIFITSATASVSSDDGHAVYAASKAAVESLARTFAVELGRKGVTANSLALGTYLTDMARGSMDQLGPDQAKMVYDAFATMSALGRWGDPAEVGGVIQMLASDAGGFITGATIAVDGGLAIKLRPS